MSEIRRLLAALLVALCLSALAGGRAEAQTGCTPRTQAANLTAWRDGQGPGTIPLSAQRDIICSMAVVFQAAAYAPVGYTLGTLTGGVPTPLSTFFGTLGAAQAVYPTATALTNYVDRVTLQKAVAAVVTAGCGVAQLPGTQVFIDAQVVWDGSCVTIAGVQNTWLRTETTGSTPPLSFSGGTGCGGCLGGNTPLRDMLISAYNTVYNTFPQSGGGTPNTGYRSGSSALQINDAFNGVAVKNVTFSNFDTPVVYATGNNYVLTFRDCYFTSNNHGINIEGLSTNSFENMVWEGGSSSNNNYGAYFNLVNGSGSLFIRNMSIDYNIVLAISYDGSNTSSPGDQPIPLFVTNVHVETNNTTSGTGYRIYNNATLFLTANIFYELGTNPVGVVGPGTFPTRTTGNGNLLPGTGSVQASVPLVYSTGGLGEVHGAGNMNRYGSDVILSRSLTTGDTLQTPGAFPGASVINSNVTLGLIDQVYPHQVTGTRTITIPPASTTFFAIGTKIVFWTADTTTNTFAPGSGVTLNTVGTGNTFGGKIGKVVGLVETAQNVWAEVGDMN